MRHAHAPAATGRTPVRVITGIVSLLVLAGALVGLPLLLAWASPVIWAATHDDLAHLLDRQDTGGAFLALLLVIGWTGWAQFAFSAVLELAAQLRGRTWRVPRGFGASQRAAAALIGSILVLLPTGSALASDAQAATTATAARLPGQTDSQQAAESSSAPHVQQDSGTASMSVHTVQAGESLWSIAEQELGYGEKWRQIAALNEGHAMADGQVFQSNSFLRAGWQLQMPAGHALMGGDRAQRATKTAGDDEASVHVVTVNEGDNLSKIAKEELGDSDEWPALFAASRGKPQPDGLPALTDPDVIYAGQQITVPEQQSAGTSPPPSESHRQEPTPHPHRHRTASRGRTPGRHPRQTAPPPLRPRRLPPRRTTRLPDSPAQNTPPPHRRLRRPRRRRRPSPQPPPPTPRRRRPRPTDR
ncbi:LysM peptidoglycan-binding domain-containing protein [Streptomyces sp. CA-100214]